LTELFLKALLTLGIEHKMLMIALFNKGDEMIIKQSRIALLITMIVLLLSVNLVYAKKKTYDFTPHYKMLPFTQEQLDNYISKGNLDPIEGVWIYSAVSIDNNVVGGKKINNVTPHPDTDEYYIIKDNLTSNNTYLLVYKKSLPGRSTYSGNVVRQFGQIEGEITKDIYGPNKFFFTYLSTGEYSNNRIVNMLLDGIEIKGSEFDSVDNRELGIKIESRWDHLYKKVGMTNTNNSANKQQYSGTGFLISENGVLVTNYHIIDGAKKIEVFFPNHNKRYNGTIQLQDKNNDLAIINLSDFSLKDISATPIPYKVVSSSQSTTGQSVFTLGYPMSDILGSSIKYSNGSITSSRDNSVSPVLMQIDNNIQPGNSGSPLFNTNGDIIGIVVSSLNAGYFLKESDFVPQNVNFAIRSDYLLFLTGEIVTNTTTQSLNDTYIKMPIETKITAISPFISIIYVEK
jgi:S1-C subfamily serine protease